MGQLSSRAADRPNEIPWTWHQGQLREQVEFLVSRSLTLSSARVSTVGGIRHTYDGPHWPQKKLLVTNIVAIFVQTFRAYSEQTDRRGGEFVL